MKQYTFWTGSNPPPSYLKTEKQVKQFGLFPYKAVGVIYGKKGKPVYLFDPRSGSSVKHQHMFEEMHERDKIIASTWAYNLLTRDFVILDTETTGLKKPEACQIAIINQNGETLMNTYVKPLKKIESKAVKVHGITNEKVKKAPYFMDIYETIVSLLTCQEVVIYNKAFDIGVLNNSLPRPFFCRKLTDPMIPYAQWVGEWNPYRADYQYQKLQGNHDALGDCLQTLEIIKKMSNEL